MAEGDGGIRTTHRHAVTVADLVRGHPAGGGHAREVLKDAAKENGHVVEIIEGKEISVLNRQEIFCLVNFLRNRIENATKIVNYY